MSIVEITAYQVECDHCGEPLYDDEFGGVLVYLTTEEVGRAVTAKHPSTDDWCQVGDAHYCPDDGCRAAARKAIRELPPAPIANLPGQLALIGEVDGVPVPFEVTG